ncbi:MAG: 50S ribosomal protein L17 [Phycisphaerae bacterium]|nr:50S ribosomal protein L17 [Phycisphaerae bacterium]
MRHRVAGKQLSRTTSHRRALRRNLAASLFQHGAIRTTETKAKELRRFVEKLITIAKTGTLHARRQVIARLQDREMYTWDETEKDYAPEDKTVVQKLFDEIAPRYADRAGGYTRIIRLPDRRIGDAGVQVILQLVEEGEDGGSKSSAGRRKQRAAKRHAAAGKAKSAAKPTEKTDEPPADEAPVAEAPVEESAADAAPEEENAE